MVYKRNTWQSGDKVTSAKLNNLEAGSVATYHFTAPEDDPYNFTLDGTFREVFNSVHSGIPTFAAINPPSGTDAYTFFIAIATLSEENNSASFTMVNVSGNEVYIQSSDGPDSYPTTFWD